MTQFSRATLSALVLALGSAAAHAEVSFNLGVVSLYKSNGLDQDNPKGKGLRPAVQGGIDKVFDNGFYVGNWNSTGRFGDANIEMDIYGGHRGKVTENLGYDIGVIRFLYPGSGGGWNGNEAYAALTWNGLTLKYAQGVSGVIKDFGRLSLGYSMPLGESWTAQAIVGFRNREAGNFDDYAIGLTKDLGDGLSMGLQLSGATHKADLGGAGDNRLVLSLIKGF